MKFLQSSLTLLCFAALSITFQEPVYAQFNLEKPHYRVWAGYSFKSIRFLGKTRNSQTEIVGFGLKKYMRTVQNDKLLFYTVDIIPHLYFHYPKRDENERRVTRSGFGISPVGFMIKKKYDSFITPYLHTSGSFIFMKNNFPTNRARKFNFTFDITLAGEISLWHSGYFSFGYKFHHISNAQTGPENPGLDSNFLFFSLSIQ